MVDPMKGMGGHWSSVHVMAAGGGTEAGGAELPPELLAAELPAPLDAPPFDERPLEAEPPRAAPLELAPLLGAWAPGWSDPMPVVLPEFDVAWREPEPAELTASSDPALPPSARPPQAAVNAQTTN